MSTTESASLTMSVLSFGPISGLSRKPRMVVFKEYHVRQHRQRHLVRDDAVAQSHNVSRQSTQKGFVYRYDENLGSLIIPGLDPCSRRSDLLGFIGIS